MAGRSRRRATNYISAAILEITIMGLFVIIAQPQLREALFELLHPADQSIVYGDSNRHAALQNEIVSGLRSRSSTSNSPEPMSTNATLLSSAPSSDSPLVQTVQQLVNVAGQVLAPTHNHQPAPQQVASNQPAPPVYSSNYAPLEQYEAFRVNVANQAAANQAAANPAASNSNALPSTAPSNNVYSNNTNTQNRYMNNGYNVGYGSSYNNSYNNAGMNNNSYNNTNYGNVGYVGGTNSYATNVVNSSAIPYSQPLPNTVHSNATASNMYGYSSSPTVPSLESQQRPTQLVQGAWNIASAAQSPRPLTAWPTTHTANNSHQDIYPPPYGTQSQWK